MCRSMSQPVKFWALNLYRLVQIVINSRNLAEFQLLYMYRMIHS